MFLSVRFDYYCRVFTFELSVWGSRDYRSADKCRSPGLISQNVRRAYSSTKYDLLIVRKGIEKPFNVPVLGLMAYGTGTGRT